ncbi:hypothetical protein AVL55_04255 [Alteromonas macleodii]|uniref:Uncharacterized protein n=1 Tax=Alteromonas macleodii TaxID=28108 RepID=A0A126PXB1_ALTMA|nr:hypothetical protein AVL55_04255 [Alteromonas macleodii]
MSNSLLSDELLKIDNQLRLLADEKESFLRQALNSLFIKVFFICQNLQKLLINNFKTWVYVVFV